MNRCMMNRLSLMVLAALPAAAAQPPKPRVIPLDFAMSDYSP